MNELCFVYTSLLWDVSALRLGLQDEMMWISLLKIVAGRWVLVAVMM